MASILASTIAVVWGLALVVLFSWHRGDDVGELPSLLRSFAIALRDEPIVRLAAAANVGGAVLVTVAIVGSWLGVGDGLTRLSQLCPDDAAHRPRSRALAIARRLGLGAGACSLAWFGFGLAGLYRSPVAAGVTLFGLALLVVPHADLLRPRASRGATTRLARIEWAALVAVAFPVVLAAVAALAPPTAKDALIYHRALPKAFVAGSGLVDVPFNIASFFALGAEMHGLWAMLLAGLAGGGGAGARVGEMAFGLVECAFFPVLLLALYGWARETGLDRFSALTATAMVAAIPTVYAVATNSYIDLALALYATLAIEAAAEFRTTGDRAPLARLALFVGFALAVKHTAIFLLVPMPWPLLLRARQEEQEPGRRSRASSVLLPGAIAVACAGLIGSGWYIRNWVRTGSPLFPFYMNLWPGHAPGWDLERSVLLQSLLSTYGGDGKTWLDYLLTPLRISVLAQPEVAAYFEGVLGITFAFGLPLLLWAACRRALPSSVGTAAAAAGLLYAQWLVSVQGLRYLLPIFPSLALALVWSAKAAHGRRGPGSSVILWALLTSTVAGHLVIASWFLEANPVRVVLGAEDRAAYLERRLDYYPYYELVNDRLPVASRVWLINMRRDTYHIERPYFSDYLFEDYTVGQWVNAARDVADLRQRARAAGITHVLVRHDVLLDPARSPIVDDRRPESVNEDKMRILRSFLFDGTNVLRHDGKFLLVALLDPAWPASTIRQRPALPRQPSATSNTTSSALQTG